MRRIQIYVDDDVDDGLCAEARRRATSRSALIREALAAVARPLPAEPADPWAAITGIISCEPIDDLDAVIYRVAE